MRTNANSTVATNPKSARVMSAYNSYASKYIIKFNRSETHATITNNADTNSIQSSNSSNTTTSGSDKALMSQVTLANEFNQKIKLTNKKLDDLNKKLNLYRMSQSGKATNSKTPGRKLMFDIERDEYPDKSKPKTALRGNSQKDEISAKSNRRPMSERDPGSSAKRDEVFYEDIAEYDELEEDFYEDKEDEELRVADEEKAVTDDLHTKDDFEGGAGEVNFIQGSAAVANDPTKSELSTIDELEKVEPRLLKSQGVYNFVATSTCQLSRNRQSSVYNTNKSDQAKLPYNEEILDDEEADNNDNNEDDEDDGADYTIYTNFETTLEQPINEENETKSESLNKTVSNNENKVMGETDTFLQNEQNVARLQRQVLARMQQAIDAYKHDHSIKLPNNVVSHVHFITSNYNNCKNKADLYKFYERSRTSMLYNSHTNGNGLRAKTSNQYTNAMS